jgi:hypothetical protein
MRLITRPSRAQQMSLERLDESIESPGVRDGDGVLPPGRDGPEGESGLCRANGRRLPVQALR